MRTQPDDKLLEQHYYKSAAGLLQLELSCACVLQTQNMIMEFSTVLKVFAVACII